MLPLKQELESRGLLKQYTDEKLFDLYDQWGQKFYFGMDPTADSLHLGNFVNFMNAVHLMRRWNICIPLVGWATGMIGDPGGKDAERSFLDEDTLAHNVTSIQKQINTLITNIQLAVSDKLQVAEVVNNKDFYDNMGFIDFLREAGKYITVNSMLTKETVKKRIEDPDKSISYTEFSYMLIQGYDFYKLYADQWVKLQIAGSDQWGNVTTGTEIIRKKTDGGEAYAFTCPLVLDSNGKKFWKSEGNAIWLDSTKNSPYFVYQYFLNVADADVERFLKLFTFYDFDTIDQIVATHTTDPATRHGQNMLAEYVVKLIFWPDAARQAQMITNILFGRGDVMETIRWLSIEDINALQREIGVVIKGKKRDWMNFLELLVESNLASSNGEAKKLIQWGGIYVNEQKIDDMSMKLSSSNVVNNITLLRKGKKWYKIVNAFDSHKYLNDYDIEIWSARELQELLWYDKWEKFLKVISKAKISCNDSNMEVSDHFLSTRRIIDIDQGEIDDFMLTKYACYLIAQNGDPRNFQIAFAQSYFATQMRKLELLVE